MIIGTGWKVNKEREEPIQCSLIKSPIVFLEPRPKYKIELLMAKYPYQEWLGYLVGRVSEKENYFVEDLSIPPHKEASMASAEAEPFHIPKRCVGVIHSHNTMGAFHSGIDQEYVDKNFPVSITVSKKNGVLEFDTVSYQTTPCGKATTTKGQVRYIQPKPPLDGGAFLKKAVENIDKGRRVIPVVYKYQKPPSYYNYRGDYIVDGVGRVMSQKELDAHSKDIYGD